MLKRSREPEENDTKNDEEYSEKEAKEEEEIDDGGGAEEEDKKKEEKLGSCCGSTYRRFKERGHETLLHTCGVPVWTQYELGRMESVFEKYGIYQMDTIRRRTWENRIPR